jgi:hypothetical protein
MLVSRESFTVTLRKNNVFTIRSAKEKRDWVVGIVALVLTVLVVSLVRRSAGEVVMFRVVGEDTGAPISNIVFDVLRPWPKQLRSLPVGYFQGFRVERITSRDGVASISGIEPEPENLVIASATPPTPYEVGVYAHWDGKTNVVVVYLPKMSRNEMLKRGIRL